MTATIHAARDSAEVAAAADLIERSFRPLQISSSLVPDPTRRQTVMRGWLHLFAQHAADGAGHLWLTDDHSAVTVWFDHTGHPGTPVDYDSRLAAVTGEFLPRFRELDDLLDAHHPNEPHWYGMLFAVDPHRQRQGLGAALISHTLDRLDRDQLPAYLEATGPDNRRLYRRLGFHDMTPADISLADGTTLHRMWRPATRPPARTTTGARR